MKNNERREHRSARQFFISVTWFVFACGSLDAGAAVEFHPHAEVSVGWTDNPTLVGDDDPSKHSAYVVQANPGFLWKQTGQYFNSGLDYTMQNVFFRDSQERNQTYHQATGQFDATIVPNYFYLDANGTYSQVLIDAHQPANYRNFFNVTNQTDALAIAATPRLRHDFGQVHVDASYSRGRVSYKRTEGPLGSPSDADTEDKNLLLTGVEDDALVTWAADYQSQYAKYSQATEFRYDHAYGELGWLLGRSVRLIGRGGAESDPALSVTKGGLDHSYWEGGLRWQPGPRTIAEGFYGKRFYGRSFNARLNHQAKIVFWEFSYVEGAQTQAQELIAYSATGKPLVANAVPGTAGFLQLTDQVYVRKTAQGTLRLTGRRTEVELVATDYRRTFLNTALGSDRQTGGSLRVTRTLAERMHFEIGGSINNSVLEDGSRFRDLLANIGLTRDLTRKIALSLTGFRYSRSGGVDYKANSVNLSLTGHF
ncbi:MAG TPA: TIGR03016 family PEP-CTERM system-associated outer membrane protein [Steroidobacteraceae bacterium]|nr:TIGR03016 family PEP-CTERM system-associated outer membrane protein [Steroidobacteraceae bacterium]